MRKKFTTLQLRQFLAYISCYVLCFITLDSHAQGGNTAGTGQYIDGQLFVKFANNCDFTWQADNDKQDLLLYNSFPELHQLLEQYHVKYLRKAFRLKTERLKDIYLLEIEDKAQTTMLMRRLSLLNYIDYAEQVPLYKVSDCPPNDPLLSQQWGTVNTNMIAAISALTNNNCDVDGSSCVNETVIAIVDDAVLHTHEDLIGKMWNNAGEIPNNGLDEDGNGYIDDIMGWDVASNDNDPMPIGATNSSFTHGTHCAGIAAAMTNNSVGVASPGFNARIMAVKCASIGNGTLPFAYLGLEYAIAAGADVISMSWGGGSFSNTYQALFDEAHAAGIVCVTAAGNNNSSIVFYPAGYNHTISVASSNINNIKSNFSNYGSTIDITAPGSGIMSTLAGSNSSYGNLSGTSMACPFVSGVCGLMLCYNPNLSPDMVLSCIQTSATNIDAQNPAYIGSLGAGLINVEGVLQCLQVPPTATIDFNDLTYCPSQSVTFNDISIGYQIESRLWTFDGGTPATSTEISPTVSFATAGFHTVTLTVSNLYGSHTTTSQVTIGTPNAVLSGSTTTVAVSRRF